MTIPALTDATRSTPPSRKKTWATFLTESLEQSWREDEWDPNEYEFTGMLNSAQTGLSVCLRDGCETVVDHGVELCSACTKAKRNLPPGAQLQPRKLNHRRRQNPKSAARFSLASLGPVVRDEILYGLQDRDRRQLAIRPFHVRQLIKKVPVSTGSLLELSDSDYSGMQRSLLRSLQQSIRRLDMLYRGDDGTEGDLWDCALVGLFSKREHTYRAVTGHLDFSVIRQVWLKELTKNMLRSLRPSVCSCQRYIQAAAIASAALTGRPNGNTPSLLNAGDMTVVCQAISSSKNGKTGAPYSESHRRAILGKWRQLTDRARSGGLMDTIPGAFAVHPEHMTGSVANSDESLGRSIPEEWIAYLDSQLSLLGTSSSHAPKGWKVEDLREMYRVYYRVLRDTGRRPSEIARLSDSPLEYVRNEPSLIYDNRKAGRHKRRLPIDQTTAAVIEAWRQHLQSLYVPLACKGYLFPAPGGKNQERQKHLNSSQFRRVFHAWVRLVPSPTGLSEAAASFPVTGITLYGFRHAYAQRHADSGTPIDVLRELMDHREIDTTMGYYQVTLKRKQKAVSLVAQMAVDRHGTDAPFPTGKSYERASVATAYGNCTEPSNVKAGGKSCPIRFQCSGCSFYRPDPSYLGAIEQ